MWGSLTHVKKKSVDKLESRIDRCLFVSYPKETIGYYFYNSNEYKVFISHNVRHSIDNKIILEEQNETLMKGIPIKEPIEENIP